MLRRKYWAALLVLLFSCGLGLAAEVIPPAPKQYFNDYAHVVSPATAAQLNKTLEDYERVTSNQILVAVYTTMQSDSSIEDYTVRVAEAWKAGQKGRNNGAVLFVFVQDHKMFLQVGYGLEGALPDAVAKQIIDNEIKPHFRNGDFDGGLRAGVNAILAATRGEYKGTGHTVAEARRQLPTFGIIFLFLVLGIVGFSLLAALMRGVAGSPYRRRGYSGGWTMGSGGVSGGGWSSGGGGWSGGGGFSGGGGSFGGGGAGGSW